MCSHGRVGVGIGERGGFRLEVPGLIRWQILHCFICVFILRSTPPNHRNVLSRLAVVYKDLLQVVYVRDTYLVSLIVQLIGRIEFNPDG